MKEKQRRCLYPMCNGLTKHLFCTKHISHEHKQRRRCAFPGCGTLVTLKRWFCDPHQKMKDEEAEKQRGSARSRGYSAKWDTVSKAYRAAHPLCEKCLKLGRTTVSELTHHIIPVAQGGAWFEYDNLEALCYACHSRQPGHGHKGG